MSVTQWTTEPDYCCVGLIMTVRDQDHGRSCMIDLETFLLGVYRKKYKNNLCYSSFWWIHFLGIQSNAE